jgi:hypothetical protein
MARSQSPPTTKHSKAPPHVLAIVAGSLTLAAVGINLRGSLPHSLLGPHFLWP